MRDLNVAVKAVALENERIAARLEKVYARDSTYGGAARRVDCRQQWQSRTALYAGGGRDGARDKQPPPRGRVPKTLGVAVCSVTGRKAFFGADGPALQQDRETGRFYSSDAARRLDQRERERGQKDWVLNGSMAWARAELKKRASSNGRQPDIDDLLDEYEEMRSKELGQDGARAGEVRSRERDNQLDSRRSDGAPRAPALDALAQLKSSIYAKAGAKSCRRTVQQAFRELDADASGAVSKDQFVAATQARFLTGYSRDVVEEVFHVLDKDNSGAICLDEFLDSIA
jgi:hypothetical protein